MISFASKYSGRKAVLRAAVCAAVLVGAQGTSFADMLGYRGYQQNWDPAKPAVTSVNPGLALPGVLGTDLVNAWTAFTASASQSWTATLTKPNFAGDGYTLKNPRLQISGVDNIEMRVAPVQDSLAPVGFQSPTGNAPVIVIHSTGTRIDAGSTSPYTTSDTDPTFHVTFDLTAYVRLAIGPRVGGVTVPSAMVVLSNSQYFPDNASAKDAQLLAPLQNFFGAREFAQRVTDGINGQVVTITGYLGNAIRTANAKLRQSAPQGSVVAGVFADSQYLNIVYAPRVQPDAGGQMSGTLTVSGLSRLPASQRTVSAAGVADCSKAIALGDTVQVQPDYVGSLTPVSFLTGTGQTVALDSQIVVSAGQVEATADGWSCHYTLGGLADKFANNVHFAAAGAKASGGLPTIGYAIDVSFQRCNVGGGTLHTTSAVRCIVDAGLCDNTLIPENGQPLNCNLIGMIEISGSGGPGVVRQNPFGNLSNPGGPVESNSAAANRWGSQNVNRASSSASAPQWGTTAAPSSALGVGSSLHRGATSSLQGSRFLNPAAPAAPSAFNAIH